MRVGDLVKPAEHHTVDGRAWDAVGVVVEWDEAVDSATETLPSSGWVRWHAHCDWTMEYADDIEIISEASA
jgi:hypothetical protein